MNKKILITTILLLISINLVFAYDINYIDKYTFSNLPDETIINGYLTLTNITNITINNGLWIYEYKTPTVWEENNKIAVTYKNIYGTLHWYDWYQCVIRDVPLNQCKIYLEGNLQTYTGEPIYINEQHIILPVAYQLRTQIYEEYLNVINLRNELKRYYNNITNIINYYEGDTY